MHVALIGCGGIARDGYLPALVHVRTERVTLVDPDPVAGLTAQEYLRASGIRAVWLRDLSSVDHGIEAAIVAVPPSVLPDAIDALLTARSRPSAILIEKPLGINFAVASEMVRRVEAVASVAYMETFLHSTAYDVLLDELASARLGPVSRVALAVRGKTPPNLDVAWRGDRRCGGEVLHDWGVHSLGLALHLLNSLSALAESPEVAVSDARWMDISGRPVLLSCDMTLEGSRIDTSVRASWEGDPATLESPDLLVECERGQLSLVVQKTSGSSNWVCIESSGEIIRNLASRRYAKELFVRGVDGFLRDVRCGCVISEKYNVTLGLEALRLVDAAYNQAPRR